MKLHELGAQRPLEQTTRLLENQVGKHFDFSQLGPRRAQGMLSRIQRLLYEHRRTPDFHTSQKDATYMQLVLLEQGLRTRIGEQAMQTQPGTAMPSDTAAANINDPKARAVMDKVKRGQTLTPDEQMTVNKLALSKESKKPGRMVREQSELQQAQVVLAAQDMIDRLQGMLEDISEMQFKDLPALADSIKNDMGVEQSSQFQSSASTALTQLLQAMQTGKTELEAAQGVLTGQAPVVPGTDAAMDQMPDGEASLDLSATPADDEVDLSLDANLDTEEEPEDGAALGRERR